MRRKRETTQISVRISIPIYNAVIENFGKEQFVRLLERGLLLAIREDSQMTPEQRELCTMLHALNAEEERRLKPWLVWYVKAKTGQLTELETLTWKYMNDVRDLLLNSDAGRQAEQLFREELLSRGKKRDRSAVRLAEKTEEK